MKSEVYIYLELNLILLGRKAKNRCIHIYIQWLNFTNVFIPLTIRLCGLATITLLVRTHIKTTAPNSIFYKSKFEQDKQMLPSNGFTMVRVPDISCYNYFK